MKTTFWKMVNLSWLFPLYIHTHSLLLLFLTPYRFLPSFSPSSTAEVVMFVLDLVFPILTVKSIHRSQGIPESAWYKLQENKCNASTDRAIRQKTCEHVQRSRGGKESRARKMQQHQQTLIAAPFTIYTLGRCNQINFLSFSPIELAPR